jgi:signal transduction histidine kinase
LNHQSAEVLLREVLENTQKFHPTRAPTVHIALECADANTLLLRVGDNGPGVPADQLDLVWQPYFQGERSFTGQVEGMGLGLALVARIVYATGGRCAVANRPDGPGLLVTIHLPLVERS